MTKLMGSFLSAFLVLLTGLTAHARTGTIASKPSQHDPSLRLSEPTEAIVADLERFIPEYMSEQEIPGVTIALIRDGEIVWQEGFGVANTITRKPITPDTIFEVASNSKVVAAYIALRLVDEGLLSLDEPLNAYLMEPWLPPSEFRDSITLRHVISHSSGLGHSTTSRHNIFVPGRGYSYSAVGFQYLQAVIEETSGRTLEDVAQEMVYAPIGMSSSSFINRADLTHRTANGHVRAILPAMIFAVLYLASLVIVGLIGLVILRIWKGRWLPIRRVAIGILTAAFVLSLMPPFLLLGMSGLSEFAWLIAFCGLALMTAITLSFLVGRIIIVRMTSKRSGKRLVLTITWSVLILIGLAQITKALTNVPVPKWTQTPARAAASMRATAGDMAAFLIELSNPGHLSEETAAQMRASQVMLSDDLSWGLGPGIMHGRQGDALWQWGQHIDFQSIMIIYPKHDFGVFVCTNNDLLNPDVAVEIAHQALGGKIEPMRRAIHLELNYREGD